LIGQCEIAHRPVGFFLFRRPTQAVWAIDAGRWESLALVKTDVLMCCRACQVRNPLKVGMWAGPKVRWGCRDLAARLPWGERNHPLWLGGATAGVNKARKIRWLTCRRHLPSRVRCLACAGMIPYPVAGWNAGKPLLLRGYTGRRLHPIPGSGWGSVIIRAQGG